MQVEAWNNEGDGVRFTAGVNDGGTFAQLFEQYLHPYALAGDRKWFPIRVSLAKYEGREVELVFATATGADGAGQDRRHEHRHLCNEPDCMFVAGKSVRLENAAPATWCVIDHVARGDISPISTPTAATRCCLESPRPAGVRAALQVWLI